MKAFVVLAAAGAAVAQNLSGVPTCAVRLPPPPASLPCPPR